MLSHEGASPVFHKVQEPFSSVLCPAPPALLCAYSPAACTKQQHRGLSPSSPTQGISLSGSLNLTYMRTSLPQGPSPFLLLCCCPFVPHLPTAEAAAACLPPGQPCVGGAPLTMRLFVGDLEHCTATCVIPSGFMQSRTVHEQKCIRGSKTSFKVTAGLGRANVSEISGFHINSSW